MAKGGSLCRKNGLYIKSIGDDVVARDILHGEKLHAGLPKTSVSPEAVLIDCLWCNTRLSGVEFFPFCRIQTHIYR